MSLTGNYLEERQTDDLVPSPSLLDTIETWND